MLTPPGEVTPRNLDLQLLTGREYLENLTADVASAREGDRILIMTSAFRPQEPPVAELLSELHQAARRRANITFGLDAYGRMLHRRYGPLSVPWCTNRAEFDKLEQSLRQLESFENASFGYINYPGSFSNALAGRSHIKVSIVRNRVYLGGVNLKSIDRLDMMVTVEDQSLADYLYGVCKSVVEQGSVQGALGRQDLRYSLDADTDLLVDVGRKHQSVILDEVFNIIDESEQWLSVSFHYLPYGAVSDRLEAAIRDRGVECEIYTNPLAYHGSSIISLAHRYVDSREHRIRIPELFSGELSPRLPGLHAKGIANEKRGMCTSHNLVPAGVKYGTAEIAVVRNTPEFGLDVRHHLQRLVADATQLTLGV